MDWIALLPHEGAAYIALTLACALYLLGIHYHLWRMPDLLSEWAEEKTQDLRGRLRRVEEEMKMHAGLEPRIIKVETRAEGLATRFDEAVGRLEKRHDMADLKLNDISETLNRIVGRLNGKG